MPSSYFLFCLYISYMLDKGSSANTVLSSVYAIKLINEINGHTLVDEEKC